MKHSNEITSAAEATCKKALPNAIPVEDQIKNLESLGLIVEDKDKAYAFLTKVSYYRLKGYSLRLKDGDGRFQDGTRFDDLLDLYYFDSALRRLIFHMIEHIEIGFRTRLVNFFSLEHEDPTGYLKIQNLNPERTRKPKKNNEGADDTYAKSNKTCGEPLAQEVIDEIKREIDNNRHSPVISNFKDNYMEGNPPFYAAAEFLSFGKLSRFYKNMTTPDRIKFRDENYASIKCWKLDSWMHSICCVRNICAHHNRLYDIELHEKPKIYDEWHQDKRDAVRNDRIVSVLLCMRRLLNDDAEWDAFVSELKRLIAEYPGVQVSDMGFPENWLDLLMTENIW